MVHIPGRNNVPKPLSDWHFPEDSNVCWLCVRFSWLLRVYSGRNTARDIRGCAGIRLTVRYFWVFLMLDTYTGPPEFFSFLCRRRWNGTIRKIRDPHSLLVHAFQFWKNWNSKNARLRQNLVLPGTSVKFKITRGATLIHGSIRALSGIPAYSRQLTYALTSQNTRYP